MDKGMHLFLSRLLQPPVKPHVLQAILAEIATERAGLVIHRSNVKAVVDVLLALSDPSVQDGPSVYTRDLEPVLLEESREFYTVEGTRLLSTCPAPEYLSRVGPSAPFARHRSSC
jgi:cullin 3